MTSAVALGQQPETTSAVSSSPVSVEMATSEAGWAEYVERHPDATVDHLWGWREVFARVFKQDCVYLLARRNDQTVGVLPLVRFRSLLFGKFVVSLPYLNYGGVLASDQDTARTLIERAEEVGREFGASHVELRHRERQATNLPCRQHKVGMVLSLPVTAGELWKDIDRKVRNQVRKAQKEGLTCLSGGVELVDQFYGVFAVNMRDLGTPVYSKQLFVETLRAFPRQAAVHVVHYQGRPVAGAVTLQFRDSVLVPWASSLRAARHLCPNMLMYWSMLEGAIARGATTFDFGRSSRDAGTFLFKQQWGATEVPLHWEYVLLNRTHPPDQGPGNPRLAARSRRGSVFQYRLPIGWGHSSAATCREHRPIVDSHWRGRDSDSWIAPFGRSSVMRACSASARSCRGSPRFCCCRSTRGT